MQIFYDVVIHDEVKETIKPINQQLKDVYRYVNEQLEPLKKSMEKTLS